MVTVTGGAVVEFEFNAHFFAELNIQSAAFDIRPFNGIDSQNGVIFDFVYQLRERPVGLLMPFVLVGAALTKALGTTGLRAAISGIYGHEKNCEAVQPFPLERQTPKGRGLRLSLTRDSLNPRCALGSE